MDLTWLMYPIPHNHYHEYVTRNLSYQKQLFRLRYNLWVGERWNNYYHV